MSEIRSVMSETYNRFYPSSDFYVGYKYKNLLVSAGVNNVFLPYGNKDITETKSPMAYKYSYAYAKDLGDMVYLNISWTFSKGKQVKTREMCLRKDNNDTGIVK